MIAPDALTYNPCDDLISPSVVRASEYLRASTQPVLPLLECDRRVFGATNERISDPCVLIEDAHWHLFVSVGPRFRQRIGLVKSWCR